MKIETYTDLLAEMVRELDYDKLEQMPDEEQTALLQEIDAVELEASREEFYIFVKRMAPVLLPGEYKDGIHIRKICQKLQEFYEAVKHNRKIGRKKMFFLPPRSMKSLLVSQLFPAWILGKSPNWKIMAVSGTAVLAKRNLGSPTKDIIMLPEYQEIFPATTINPDHTSVEYWKTTKGGSYQSASIDAKVSGMGANILIGDDAMIDEDAFSPTRRAYIKEHRWEPTFAARLNQTRNGQLHMATRWVDDDLTGHLIERDKDSDQPWDVTSIPAFLDEEAWDFLTDGGTNDYANTLHVGGSYWPERITEEWLLNKKQTLGSFMFSAQYLQNPVPAEGNIFKKDHIRHYTLEEPPECSNIIVSIDTAWGEKYTKTKGDYTAYSIWGIFPRLEIDYSGKEHMVGNMLLLGAARGRWDFHEFTKMCQDLYKDYNSQIDFFLVEKQSVGHILISELRKVGLPVVEYQPEKDKQIRAHSITPVCEAGRIWVNPNKSFSQEFLTEVLRFPAAPHDDFVDTFTQAVLWMRQNWHIDKPDDVRYDDDDDNVVPFRRSNTYWSRAKS